METRYSIAQSISIFLLLCALLLPQAVFAGNSAATPYEKELSYYGIDNSMTNGSNLIGADTVTTEDLEKIIIEKGNSIVSVVKITARFICITGFIISCIMSILAALFGEHSLFRSILGALIAGISYALITEGEQVTALFLSFLKS